VFFDFDLTKFGKSVLLVLNRINNFKLSFRSVYLIQKVTLVVIEWWSLHSNLYFADTLLIEDGINGNILKKLKLFLNSNHLQVFQLSQLIIHF